MKAGRERHLLLHCMCTHLRRRQGWKGERAARCRARSWGAGALEPRAPGIRSQPWRCGSGARAFRKQSETFQDPEALKCVWTHTASRTLYSWLPHSIQVEGIWSRGVFLFWFYEKGSGGFSCYVEQITSNTQSKTEQNKPIWRWKMYSLWNRSFFLCFEDNSVETWKISWSAGVPLDPSGSLLCRHPLASNTLPSQTASCPP